MSERRYFLGVDGGGTKTEFVCIDDAGEVLTSHLEPTSYHLQVGLDGARRVIEAGVAAICSALTITPADFAHVFFGLPAFGEDKQTDPQLERICGKVLDHSRYLCGNDMVCGWAGSLGCEDGITLVAGTGSIGYGERQGHSARVGGWGEVFSDEGSAYWIAIQGLNAFTRMSDGRLPKSALYDAFRQRLALVDDLDICARVMGPHGLGRDEIARLSLIVAQAADKGDAEARNIQVRAVEELVRLAEALRNSLGFKEEEVTRLSWSGGVLRNVAGVRETFRERIEQTDRYQVIEPRHEPGYGAALYALKRASPSA